ncbi:MAG: acetolactate synthase [Verrucomicrobiae bacterium]|nr:acetolactate synthase [Verrucomicrobiae bacterium]MCP5539562.1 acetolactate synthase [Akkermansiaceae bacterium]MCP5550038.1 acetolactate synthase [Akkermansiaceae bacterium]
MEIDDSEATTVGTPVRQLSVFLQNRVGALLSVVQLMEDHHVVVLGLSVQDSIDVTVVRLVVSDPDLVETTFMERGIPFSTTEIIVVEFTSGATGLSDCLRSLLNAETNVHFVYPILSRPNDRPVLALCLEDNEFGKSVLLREGYKLLFQEDLSR